MNRDNSIIENKENFNDNMNNGEGKKKTHTKTLTVGNLDKNVEKSTISYNDNSGLLNNPLNDKVNKRSQVKKPSNILIKKSEEQILKIPKNSQIVTENPFFLVGPQNQIHNPELKNIKNEEEDLSFCLNPNNLAEYSSNNTAISINDTTFYLNRENSILLKNYGSDVYNYTKDLELDFISAGFLLRHKISPEIRTKMVDWMIEVISVYKSETETLFLSVSIMDLFINRWPNTIRSDEIHIIGMTSMFIASKFEDLLPIRMSSLVSKIGHNIFNEKQIKSKEKKILETIGFESLISSSVYEFIKTYFYDFMYNNRDHIREFKLSEIVKSFEKAAIFMSKIMLHHEVFYLHKQSLKAVACVIAAFDLLRTNSKTLKDEGEKFLRDWLMFLIQESTYQAELIGEVYTKLVDHFRRYDNISSISHNLTKYTNMVFE